MTQKKKLKKAIRSRARKTGESYTAARRQVLVARARKAPRVVASPPPASVAASRHQARAVVSDAAVLKKTGQGLDHWFAVLDAFGTTRGHGKAANHLHAGHGVPMWYAQGITVAWERARGLRVPNQSFDGTFQFSVSKTVPGSVAQVAAVLSDVRRRTEWLKGAPAELGRALQAALSGPKARQVSIKDAKHARLRYPWDGGTVEIYIDGKPKGASVVAYNLNLADASLVEPRRAQWRQALESLREALAR